MSRTSGPDVRVAEPGDLPRVADIERRAETLFHAAGFPPFPDYPREHEPFLILVAGRPATGFARLVEMDGDAHLDELDVLPEAMRRGIGTALVHAACRAAQQRGYRRITLTTFRDLEWNGPFYRRLGFAECTDPGTELAAERRAEREAGLDGMSPRIALVRSLLSDWKSGRT